MARLGARARLAVAAGAILIAASSALPSAQVHIILTNIENGSLSTSLDLDSGRVDWEMRAFVGPLRGIHLANAMAVSADGRWAVWASDPIFQNWWIVRDLVTNATTVTPIPSQLIDLVAHPRRPVMYGTHIFRGTVLIAEPSRTREVRVCPRPSDATITLDGALLFVSCEPREIVVLDTERALVVGRFTIAPGIRAIEVNADGSRVFVLGWRGTEPVLEMYDWPSGALSASLPVAPPPECCPWTADRSLLTNADRSELYAGYSFYSPTDARAGTTWVHSTATLHRIATIPGYIHAAAFTPDGRTAIALTGAGGAWPRSVLRVDARAHAIRATSDQRECYRTAVAMRAAPLPPVNVQATVDGGTVMLRWQLPAPSPMATMYQLEASRSPGGLPILDLTVPADQPMVSVPGVPRGTYYIRIRAANAVGVSQPSFERAVVVQ